MTKFCKYCGKQIDADARFCTHCGGQLDAAQQSGYYQPNPTPNVIINNVNANYGYMGKPKDKWVALVLCILFGAFGVHKFYEGRIGLGILYLFTFGLCGIGVLVDVVRILFKPNPYYVM